LIVDADNTQVRKLDTSTQIVSAVAGGYTGNGIPGTLASLNGPESIAFDSAGNMYIAEFYGNRVRKLSTAGTITTFAGTGVTGYSGDGGAATSATLFGPAGVAADKLGNVYITDTYNVVIRKVNALGKISTFAHDSRFSGLSVMAIDASNNLYVADYNACAIFRITPASVVSVVAGVLNTCGFNADGISATTAYLNSPYGVAVDSAGNLYIADSSNNRVRRVTGGKISTVAGNGTCGHSGDGGLATKATLCLPTGLAMDSLGSLLIGDYNNGKVRRVAAGVISTLAGTGTAGYNGDGLLATQTNLDGPAAVAVSPAGVVYVDDDGQYRVRKIH
jgi:sugar lactone lactonase YvrE